MDRRIPEALLIPLSGLERPDCPDSDPPALSRFRVVGCALLFAMAATVSGVSVSQDGATESRSPVASPGAAPAEVAQWAAQLGDPRFPVRQTATEKLIAAGATAIEPVTAAALGGSLEAGLRAVHILTALYEADDETIPVETLDRTQLALEKIAAEGPASTGQEAAAALDRNLFTITQRRSIEAVRNFGGQIKIERDDPVYFDGSLQYPPLGWVRSIAVGRDWTGGRAGLEHLARLKTTQIIYLLKGHPLSEDDKTYLLQNLPQLRAGRGLEPRGSAFLGVSTLLDPIFNFGANISEVAEASAAAQGGLLRDDVVVEIAGQAVTRPEDLIAIIAQFDPDDEVEIVVLRDKPHMTGIQSRYVLREMMDDTRPFAPILAIGILENLRTPLKIRLGEWRLDN